MPWIVGIDEAGYGPNLGPFVMSAVACQVPGDHGQTDLWQTLRPVVRRQADDDDGRLPIDDSKVVYTKLSLRGLETSVLATLYPVQPGELLSLGRYLDWVCPGSHPEICREPWYTGQTPLPVRADLEQVKSAGQRFAAVAAGKKLAWGLARSMVICPSHFNELTDKAGSKGAALGHCLGELLRWALRPHDDEPTYFYVDKHGGRKQYAPLVQQVLSEGTVFAQEERPDKSSYRILGLKRDVSLTFQPRAEAEHFCVALASMLSKYLREVLMGEFNDFWQQYVPELKKTAGYPGDARRFYDAIRPAAEQLGIDERALWRSR